ncbi:chemotaxis protein CheW [Altererythrobacter aurantiacus]|uniref:Chemotaxis protein CheW n=1 Tax=Parapontixanthobacter aurantiacus TaxID=1463599 RepID=A0A844ZC76_9SPHN|nr:chemotaxis protein CheW [Parapontixanthobacter aurantiacus]MXO84520.1 chemotaxis protein CheW [Parapontixanthobacter aurantiacus]
MTEMLLIANIDGRRAAIPASEIASVIEIEEIVAVPMAPSHIVGLTAMRSQALTVVCCRSSLGLVPMQYKRGDRAVVIKIDGHQYALLVDEVEGVVMSSSEPEPVKGGFGEHWNRVALGKVETSGEPAVLIDHKQIVKGPQALAA